MSTRRDSIARFWPRAFTMVSSIGWSRPVRQTMRITPVRGGLPHVRYRIVPDQHWLEAFPSEWTSTRGEVEIAVTENGAALAAEAYQGKLKILTVNHSDSPTEGTPTGLEIPVHFVAKPSDGAEEPTVDDSSGLSGGDDHGNTRGVARGRLERVGDEDCFRFRTTDAQTWVTAYTASEGDTVGELHTAGGATASDHDSGTDGNFRVVASVPAGVHYLRVTCSGTPGYVLLLDADSFPIEFVRIPAGSFMMGSPEDEEGRHPSEWQHEVRISQECWPGKYEVTQREWEAVMGTNPSGLRECGARCPVEWVSWDDVQEFIRRLNERESGSGYVYRLPTEAEREYAARAGTTGVRYGELDSIAWYSGNSGRTTHPVGQKRASAWGLHDMLGNVWEWVADW